MSMTTNGIGLERRRAESLKQAGLNRINVSLDTLDPDRFAHAHQARPHRPTCWPASTPPVPPGWSR